MSFRIGKLTPEQLLDVISLQPLIDGILPSIQSMVLSNLDQWALVAPQGFRWAAIYELPIRDHIDRLLPLMMGKSEFVRAAQKSLDPHAILMADIRKSAEDETHDADASLNYDILGKLHTFPHMYGWLFALLKSAECVAVYGKHINDFVTDSREGGTEGDAALFKAVRIDPTVITGPTGARRFSTAMALGEESFLDELRLALQGKTGDQIAYLRKFRVAMQALAEAGGLNQPPTQLARQLVELGIYEPGPSAVKNAAELIRKSKQLFAI